MARYETRAVLAGAKWGMAARHLECSRTHVVEVPDTPLCRRVKSTSLADRQATNPFAPPSCEDCVRIYARLVARGQIRVEYSRG